MSNLPKNWTMATMSTIARLIRGVNYNKAQARQAAGEGLLPVLRANSIDGILNFNNLVYVPKDRISEDQLVRKGDIIIAMSSGSKQLVGKAAQAFYDFDGGFGAFCGLIRPSPELEAKYLGYFFQTEDYRRGVSEASAGVNINNLRREHIESIKVPIAPRSEQRQIVAEIEKQFTRLDAGIAALKRVKANLKRYRAAVLKSACEGKLVPIEAELAKKEKRKYETGQQLLERILDERRKKWNGRRKYKEPVSVDNTNLPRLPDSWVWVSWETVLACDEGAFKRGPFGSALKKSIFVEKGFKVYEQYCPINDDCSFARYYITSQKFEELRSFEVKVGDFLISCSGVTLGRITQVPSDFEKGIINQALLRVRLNNRFISDKYFLYLFRSAIFQKSIFDNSTGSAIPNVKGVKELKAMAVPLAPLEEQIQINAEIERRFSVIEELEKVVGANLQRANRLRQSILQQAFSGKLTTEAIPK